MDHEKNGRKLITRNAAAKLRGVSDVTVLNWVKHGHLREACDEKGDVIRVDGTGQTFFWEDEVRALVRPRIGRPRTPRPAPPPNGDAA